jgi:hypothetical protein
MSFYVRYRELPIKFLEMAGNDVANQVATNMASTFTTQDAALSRAYQQWGDVGLEHVEICTVGEPHKADKALQGDKVTPLPREKQNELL